MKKVILFTVAFVWIQCSQISAQSEYRTALQKGSLLVGGSMDINLGNAKYEYSSQTDKHTLNSINFNPSIGFFASHGFAVGLSLDLVSEKEKYSDTYNLEGKRTEYLVGPFMRVYTRGGVFFSGNYLLGKSISEYKYSGDSNKETSKTSKWKLGIGYAAFLNEHVALEPSLSYQAYASKEDDGDSNFTYRTGQVVIGLGLSIYLRAKSNATTLNE